MQQRVHRRILQLEIESVRLRSIRESRDRDVDKEKAVNKIRLFLRLRGVEQTPMESLFDALARALGVGSRELRAQMLAGVDPIKKWFSENRVYEEIERRQAAGTWPAAQGVESQDVRL